jgi:hypothetical protein
MPSPSGKPRSARYAAACNNRRRLQVQAFAKRVSSLTLWAVEVWASAESVEGLVPKGYLPAPTSVRVLKRSEANR